MLLSGAGAVNAVPTQPDRLVLVPVSGPPPTNAFVPAVSSSAAFSALPGFEEKVLAGQAALASRGFSPGSLDGVMGGQTHAALRAFQESEGLRVTGILDQDTRARLGTNGVATFVYWLATCTPAPGARVWYR